MSKRISAKYKIDRRMGENIWGRPKSPVNRRDYGPGQHGQNRRGKLSRTISDTIRNKCGASRSRRGPPWLRGPAWLQHATERPRAASCAARRRRRPQQR